jgi:ABC-type glycerol-3-phosphate transport system substrate-binding protein
MIKRKPLSLLILLLSLLSTGCAKDTTAYEKNTSLPTTPVTLRLAGQSPSFKALQTVFNNFKKIYPNVTVTYEYIQNYSTNLKKRFIADKAVSDASGTPTGEEIDLFITENITSSSAFKDYALNLNGVGKKINLSQTYSGFIKNFTIQTTNELYAVPFGGEVRGMYVNKTLLNEFNLKVPTNYSEFMSCCKTLKDAGYIPLQGNPGVFSQLLMYPYCCDLIANADDYQGTYDKVNSIVDGVSEIFRAPMQRLYDIITNYYYNYDFVEKNYYHYTNGSDTGAASDFLTVPGTITYDGATVTKSTDKLSRTAFLPESMSFQELLDNTKEEAGSNQEYEFILSPMGDNGGFAYLSPSSGIAVARYSPHQEFALEFMNYLFNKKINKAFAKNYYVIPNTDDTLDLFKQTFPDAAANKRLSNLGQVTFDYVFYNPMKAGLMACSKGNKQKTGYMDQDSSGNWSIYPFSHFMDNLETEFQKVKKAMNSGA